MTNITIEQYKVRNEDAYLVNIGKTLSTEGTSTLHIENPVGDGVRAVITGLKVSSPDGKVVVEQPYNFDIDTIGPEHPVDNRARGSAKETSMNVYEDTTYSNVDHVDTSFIGSGTGGSGSVAGGVSNEIANTLLSDSDFIITVRNPSTSNTRDVSITVTYYETVSGEKAT